MYRAAGLGFDQVRGGIMPQPHRDSSIRNYSGLVYIFPNLYNPKPDVLASKLLVSPLITPILLPYITPR